MNLRNEQHSQIHRQTSAGNERCGDVNTSGNKLESRQNSRWSWVWTFLDDLWRWILLEDEGRCWKTESSKCSDIFVKNEFVFRPERRKERSDGTPGGWTTNHSPSQSVSLWQEHQASPRRPSAVKSVSFWRGLISIIIWNNECLGRTRRSQPSRPSTMMINTGVRSIIFFSMSMMSSWSLAPSMNSSSVSSPEGARHS